MAAGTPNRTAQDEDLNPKPPSDSWSYEHTRILPEAFDSIDPDAILHIFDAGPAVPQTIEFLRRFHCRLYVADLFSPTAPERGIDSATEFLNTVGDVRFDVCLLWDYINYPDEKAFAEFVSALANHVHDKTRLYAIGAYSAQVPLKAYRYAISDVDRLAIRVGTGAVPRPRSRNDVAKAMRRFVVHRAALRRDNRLEMLIRSSMSTWR